jgi:hypothetical protein
MATRIRGVLAPVLTPFNHQLEPDVNRPFRNLRAKSADLESVGFQWVALGLFV